MKDTAPKASWKVNQVIIHRDTGHPYLVLHTSNFYTGIVDLMSNDPLVMMLTLLPRHYEEYTLEYETKLKKNEVKELERMREIHQFRSCLLF